MKKVMVPILVLGVVILLIAASSGTDWAQNPDYVGSAKCKMCHMKPHKVWSESKHAKAFERLNPEQQKDPKCLACHATGYQKLKKVGPETQGVQCEACHGPASAYLGIHPRKDKEGARQAGMLSRPDPATCKGCHNEQSPTFKGFDYEKMWEQIKHPK